jgi:hypothetical protein
MSFNAERFVLYTRFVEERHNVWLERQIGAPGPWTDDPILASKKFTNVFRVLDPGSQYVFRLKSLTPETTLMRLFLYRHTGRVEAWEWLTEQGDGYLPDFDDLDTALEYWQQYRAAGNPVFTGAYLVYPQSSSPGTDKLESIIRLTQRLFGPERLAEEFLQAATPSARFAALRRHKGVADFMSMQILTDWGYLYPQDENEFIVPGPGARRGIQAITKTPDQVGFLRFAREELLAGDDCPTLNLDDKGSVRYPSIMDVQNTMCEFSKYVRYLDSGKVMNPYRPAHPGAQPDPILPSHWATTTR